MALQGTLETFALPDVLRLLASTKKTGCYRLTGDRGSGALWVKDGQVVGGEFSGSPNAKDADEITFELLRFTDGEFVFDADAEPTDPKSPADVEATLGAAEKMLEEWKEIEAAVPSLDKWVALNAELPSDEVTIRADRWISIVAIGGGTTVARLGSLLGHGELPVSREVKALLEAGLVTLGDPPAGAPAPAPVAAKAEPEPEPEPVVEPAVDEGDDASVIEFTPLGAEAPAEEAAEEFVSFDPNGLIIEEPPIPTADEVASGPLDDVEVVFDSELDEEPAAEPAPAPKAAVESSPTDAAEIARQLANLSPKAAKAVAAAAKATTQEEREAALAEVDDDEDPINRELLLKFLGSVNT